MGKRGPASKGEYNGQTSVLSTRLTPELRSKLEEAVATRPNSTISREVEHRLRKSFESDSKIESAFGSRRNYAFMRAIAMVLEFWHSPSDLKADWMDDPTAYDQATKKIINFLEAMRPEGLVEALSADEEILADNTARTHPRSVLLELQNASDAIPLRGGARSKALSIMKDDLGSSLSRRPADKLAKPSVETKSVAKQPKSKRTKP